MSASPAVTPVTAPLSLTRATLLSEEDQIAPAVID
jgi:hypothetical protein